MARYFFKLVGDQQRMKAEWIEFQDDAAAKRHAVDCISKLMREEPQALVDGQGFTLEVSDKDGAVLLRINASARPGPVAESEHESLGSGTS